MYLDSRTEEELQSTAESSLQYPSYPAGTRHQASELGMMDEEGVPAGIRKGCKSGSSEVV